MDEDKKDTELRFLYKITTDDIEHTKTRQWSVIYFSLLILAGIIGFYKLMEIRFAYFYWFQRPFLVILATYINMVGIYLLMETQRTLYILRARLAAITSRFEQDVQDIIKISPIESEKNFQSYWRDLWVPILPFIILIIAGLLCDALMLINFHPMAILAGVIIVNIPFFIYLHTSNKKKLQKVEHD